MRKLLLLFCLVAVLLVPATSLAATITASTLTVPLGQTTLDLTLDPEGVNTGAWLVVLDATGISIDSISTLVPGGTDCQGLTSTPSFDGQCASMPLMGAAVVAQVTITASTIGGTLSLLSGNITDFDSFDDTPFAPGVLVTVEAVPEPGTGVLAGLGVAGLAWSSRRRLPKPPAAQA